MDIASGAVTMLTPGEVTGQSFTCATESARS